MKDDLDHKEYLLQKYELKIYHYERYLLKKGQLENDARQLLQHFRLEQPLHDQRVSNAISDNLSLRKQLDKKEAELVKLRSVRDKDQQIIQDLNNTIENMKKTDDKEANKENAPTIATVSSPELDFFQMHQLRMLPSLKLSLIEGGGIVASGWTNDQLRRESITTDVVGNRVVAGRRDTIQEIVQSFN